MTGYKTWIGLILTTLGALGLYENSGIAKEQVAEILDSVSTLAGLVLAAYGNWNAHKRLQESE